MLHAISEIAHFMNCPNFCPLHELAFTPAHFSNWAILCSFYAHFMNSANFYVVFEVRLLASLYFHAHFVKWARVEASS
jgi:hypothetical protein